MCKSRANSLYNNLPVLIEADLGTAALVNIWHTCDKASEVILGFTKKLAARYGRRAERQRRKRTSEATSRRGSNAAEWPYDVYR